MMWGAPTIGRLEHRAPWRDDPPSHRHDDEPDAGQDEEDILALMVRKLLRSFSKRRRSLNDAECNASIRVTCGGFFAKTSSWLSDRRLQPRPAARGLRSAWQANSN
jgi:hypothetical protein